MEAGLKKEQKIKDLYDKLQGGLFKPDFNLNSKYILEQKHKEDLIKQDNGKSKNINYYDAIPRCALEGKNVTLRGSKSKSAQKSNRFASP